MALSSSPFGNIFTFTRASVAQDFDLNGALVQSAINAIRQGYDPATLLPAGWLLEGAATNSIRNPRAEGAIAPSTLPTNWVFAGAAGGTLALVVVGTGTESGIPYIEVQYVGDGTGNRTLLFEATNNIAAASGQTWTHSVYLRLIAGSLTNLTVALESQNRTAANANVGSNLSSAIVPTGAALSGQRSTYSRTIADASTAFIAAGLRLAATGAVDATLRIGGVQCEQNYYASSLILPAVGTPAATIRATDALSITGSQFTQIFGASAPQGWVIADVLMPQQAGAATSQHVATISDGTLTNRLSLFNSAGGSAIGVFQGPSGLQTGTTFVAGTPFRVGMRWGSGAVSLSKDGAAVQTIAAATPSGLTTLMLGNSVPGGGQPLNGRIRGVWAGSFNPSDAKFRAACTPNADVDAALRS